jgi:hypothetical protein
MIATSRSRSVASWLAAGSAVAAGAYAAWAATMWLRYGHAMPPRGRCAPDELLDRFMPEYDVVERHSTCVRAPAEVTFAASTEMRLFDLPIVRAIFRARELILRSAPDTRLRPEGLLNEVRALGWGVLAEVPGREIVVGAVTKPWEPNPQFRALAPADFAAWHEPAHVKIVWTLRADPAGPDRSVFRTETRAVATDAGSRARFRRYWALVSPGIVMIRWLSLGPLRRDAVRRARARIPAPA